MKTTIRPGRPRKGEEALRRDQLLDRAIQLFAEHGYGNVSLETLAREAHVSLRTIYSQFGGKAALFGTVIRRLSDEFAASLPLDESALARPLEDVLAEFGRQYLCRITRAPCICLRAQIQAEAHRFPELAAEFYHNGPERTLIRLADFFALQQKAGRVLAEDCRFLAGQFLASLRGERFLRVEWGLEEPLSEQEAEDWAKKVTRQFLQGCGKGSSLRESFDAAPSASGRKGAGGGIILHGRFPTPMRFGWGEGKR
ncbi:TetR/AcrR family transcriptional regulator [Candidatus Methylocalor cossyra]|uniref:Transcriptional regulator, TetR family n=1 Tax=Candidatus Methylocalor cossyra TaxID=3108543 RepID=A0ABM9NKY9_9GAMM